MAKQKNYPKTYGSMCYLLKWFTIWHVQHVNSSCIILKLPCSYLKLCTSQQTLSPGQEKYQKCIGQASNRPGRNGSLDCAVGFMKIEASALVMLDIQLYQQMDYFWLNFQKIVQNDYEIHNE